jgi:putative ABC transport system ATP-binding protein
VTAPAARGGPPADGRAGGPVVELDGVCRTFPMTPPVQALRSIDLRIGAGEDVAIVGPSGSGKSTLLHVLGCLDRPTAGVYRLDGIDVAELSDAHRTGLRGRRIGFVFQAFHLMVHRTVRENVEAAALYDRTSRSVRRKRAERAIERVGMSHRIDARPRTLSGGEQQRVAVARAILSEPSLLLADEPTGNLDSENTAALVRLFDALRADGMTLVMVTHDDAIAARAERQLHMVDGELVAG